MRAPNPGPARQFSKQPRPYASPVAPANPNARYIAVPKAPPANSRMNLTDVLPDLAGATQLVFHTVGDSGGVNGEAAQLAVADAMVVQVEAGGATRPRFLYHLGDVVYFNGISTDYEPQFYDPYKFYEGPIFAIPGNHDGSNIPAKGDPADPEPPLMGFMDNFCDTAPSQNYPYRKTMNQPYVYFVLDAPLVRFIGLYSNVDGLLDSAGSTVQQAWFESVLAEMVGDARWVVVAVHHPPFSLDTEHGGYTPMLNAITAAATQAGKWPDVVLSGHVHNYQRFTYHPTTRDIPCVVAGAGGYAETAKVMHRLVRPSPGTPVPVPFAGVGDMATYNLTLAGYNENSPGFLRVTINPTQFKGEYFVVPFDGTQPPVGGNVPDSPAGTPPTAAELAIMAQAGAQLVDTWTLDKATGVVTTGP